MQLLLLLLHDRDAQVDDGEDDDEDGDCVGVR